MIQFAQVLNSYFQDLEQQDLYSGVVLITQNNATLYSGTFSYASRAWKIRNTLDTRFDTASITKLFTAVATLQCIEQGLFGFDTKVIDTLGIENTTISREVTVYHLLTHTSGIGDDADEEAGENYEDVWKDKPNYSVTNTVDFLPQFIHKPPNFAPGQGCRYNNVGFVLLGLMVEKASGMTYRDYVQQHIFAKAGMRHSGFFRMDRVEENVAEGSDPLHNEAGKIIGWKRNIYSYPPIGSPDGGANVTVGDLNCFLHELKAGHLLSSEMTQAFLTPQVQYQETDQWTIKFGYGLAFYFNKSGDLMFYQKEGINAGTSAFLRHYPASNLTFVLLSNMMEGVWKPARKIHELIMEKHHDR